MVIIDEASGSRAGHRGSLEGAISGEIAGWLWLETPDPTGAFYEAFKSPRGTK